jgi:hypothetical protein
LNQEPHNEETVLIFFDFMIKGHETLKKIFDAYLDMIGDLKLKSTDNFTVTEETIFLGATLETSKLDER